jgi:tetratricopeptide (TPR) repeat protein
VKRKLLVFGLLIAPVIVIVVQGLRGRSVPPDPLAGIQEKIGTRSVSPLLERLRKERAGDATVFLLSAQQARLEGKGYDATSYLERAGSLGVSRLLFDKERRVQAAASDPRHAKAILEPLLAGEATDIDIVLTLGEAELQLQQHEGAAKYAEQVLQQTPADVRALTLRGSARFLGRQLGLARADLEAAVATGSDSVTYTAARLTLATCMLDLGEWTRALELFRAVLIDDPTRVVAMFGVGRALSYLGQLEESERSFLAVLQLRPRHVDTLLALAQLVEQRGELERALKYVEEAEKGDPNRLETLARMAKLLTACGQPERAEQYEKKYRALDPTRKVSGANQRAE